MGCSSSKGTSKEPPRGSIPQYAGDPRKLPEHQVGDIVQAAKELSSGGKVLVQRGIEGLVLAPPGEKGEVAVRFFHELADMWHLTVYVMPHEIQAPIGHASKENEMKTAGMHGGAELEVRAKPWPEFVDVPQTLGQESRHNSGLDTTYVPAAAPPPRAAVPHEVEKPGHDERVEAMQKKLRSKMSEHSGPMTGARVPLR